MNRTSNSVECFLTLTLLGNILFYERQRAWVFLICKYEQFAKLADRLA